MGLKRREYDCFDERSTSVNGEAGVCLVMGE